jgi:hypothetical protein
MSTSEKTLERMRRNPRGWRIEDIISVARRYNLLMRIEGGSNYAFSFPGVKDFLTAPAHKPIKPIYIKLFIRPIERIEE